MFCSDFVWLKWFKKTTRNRMYAISGNFLFHVPSTRTTNLIDSISGLFPIPYRMSRISDPFFAWLHRVMAIRTPNSLICVSLVVANEDDNGIPPILSLPPIFNVMCPFPFAVAVSVSFMKGKGAKCFYVSITSRHACNGPHSKGTGWPRGTSFGLARNIWPQ